MKTVIMILMAMVMATGTLYGQATDQPPPVPSQEQPEVLTRGPVNEAFAQPVNLEEENGFIAPKAPPSDIEETPPEERPTGEQFAWIPGYWAWDSDRNEYIWVSGCWRAVPPGKYWVPGYWTEVANGWRWVAGFWAPVSSKEIEYLPAPPAVTYVKPPVTVVSDKIWVPPCWYWSYGRYTLRAGYWIDAREDWVWVPSHYVWTPRGYVFVNGHWDYPLSRRGVLFAPLYFPGNIYTRVRFSYSLSIVIDIGNLEFALFTRPRYCHYYFGDYYDSFYIGIGIFPWFECVSRHTWYDPIYLHDRWRHRKHGPRWRQHEQREYARRRAYKNLRPPRTYREMERKVRNMRGSQRRNFEVAVPMKRHMEKKTTTFKFRQNKTEVRRQISRHADDVHRYVRERSKRESPVTAHKTGRPVMQRRVPSAKRAETPTPIWRSSRESSVTSHRQRKPSNVSRREEKRDRPDNVKVRTSRGDKKKGGSFRERPPSQPAKEREERKHRR